MNLHVVLNIKMCRLWLLLLPLCYKVEAQTPSLICQQITNTEGLSNSSINCIYQDSLGLMWFGTWDGLNRYNGHEFKIYKPEAKNKSSISNNIIRNIIEERKGILWIATDEGVNRFDTYTQQFSRFCFETTKPGTHREKSYLLARDGEGFIFCAVYELGLSYYNPAKNEFVPLQIPGVNTFIIRAFFFDDAGNLWILQETGALYRVYISKSRDGIVKASGAKRIGEELPPVKLVYPGEGNMLWLLDERSSLYRLNLQSEQSQQMIVNPALQPALYSITALTTYHGDLLIAHANGGVSLCSLEDNRIIARERLFSQHGIFSLYRGSQDILWVGTDGQGVYKAHPNQKNFIHFSNKQISGITSTPIRSFCEVAPGQFFVGTKGGGLYRIRDLNALAGSGKSTIEKLDSYSGLSNNAVFSLFRTGNMLWIGTDGAGIDMLEINSGRLHHLSPPAIEPSIGGFGSVYAICQTPDSSIWLGTSGYGLIRLKIGRAGQEFRIIDYKKYSFLKNKKQWLSSNVIYSLCPGKGDILWIGTRGGGLNKFNYRSGQFETFQASEKPQSLSSNDVLCIAEDAAGNLWIGTSNGINCLSNQNEKEDPVFVNYFEKDGLPNNTVHGIIEDEKHQLWISTNSGVSLFDPNTGKFTNYTVSDGLQNNEFSDGAYYRSPFDKKIYFGGINGFNGFSPSGVSISSFEPVIYLNRFKLYNSKEGDDPLPGAVNGNSRLSLAWDQNFFSIDFIALDYINNEKCEYAYLLENFNKDWVNIGTAHSADFTNVPPGDYVLKIKATNSDRVWSERIYSLPIHIRLPWWKTPLAYAVYCLLVLGALYGIYRRMQIRIRFNRSLWEERMNHRKEEEIHEAKLRFFTNIAHEFCAPLTLIYGPCEKILDYKFSDSYIRRFVQIIKSNAERMLSLIQQLMDFRKTETGHLPLQLEEIDIREMTRYITDGFAEVIERNQVKFSVAIDAAVNLWLSDRSSLDKILYNLLSNAFKYTPARGIVSVNVALQDDQLRLRISNTGKGIRKEDLRQLFDRFRILDNFESQAAGGLNIRTGLGLALTKGLVTQLKGSIEVESELGKITTFTVLLPKADAAAMSNQVNSNATVVTAPLITPMESLNPDLFQARPLGPVEDSEGKLLVMVVDDEKDIQDFLHDILSERYAVVTADGTAAALELLKEKLPDIIICDVLMSGLDGLEFTREIKNNVLTRHIPVVLLTGKRSVADQIKGASAGADIYLPKPFYPRHLLIVIDKLLDSRKKLKDYYSSPASDMAFYNGNPLNREDHEFMMKITRFVEQNLENENLNPAFVCTELAVSRMQLYRKIKEITGLSPSEFIRTVRLKYASRLILTSSKTVQEIMFESGFNNKAYFFREFNKMFKTSPGEYRNTHQYQANK